MKVSFYGSSSFSLEILKSLKKLDLDNQIKLAYVVSQPAKPVGRKKILTNNPVAKYAIDNNIPLFLPNRLSELFSPSTDINLDSSAPKQATGPAKEVLETDLAVVAAYGKIIPISVLNTAKYGFINFHGSLLPKYRGAIPVQMTILNQEKTGGITVIKMNEGMDTGEIIKKYDFEVNNEMTGGELMGSLAALSAGKLLEDFSLIMNPDSWNLQVQNEEDATTCYVKDFTKEKVEVTFFDSVKEAHGKIMAANPEPIAWVSIADKKYNLYRSTLAGADPQLPTKKAINFQTDNTQKRLFVQVFDGFLEILEIQPEGKNIMDARSFINGYLK